LQRAQNFVIGLFDSGSGGLTVLRAAVARLPQQEFVYLGDHLNAPYGTRAVDDVHQRTIENVERLFAFGCELVVLACNTASAVSLRGLQQEWLPSLGGQRRVLGVLAPMVEAITLTPFAATATNENHDPLSARIGVFGTQSTIDSGAYVTEIRKRALNVRVFQQACPDLVSMIEDAAPHMEIEEKIGEFSSELVEKTGAEPLDAVVLGCTHYALIADSFARALPFGVKTLNQPNRVAKSLALYLERHPRFFSTEFSPPVLYTTGDPAPVNAAARRFINEDALFDGFKAFGD
jgi:glutamate racemase